MDYETGVRLDAILQNQEKILKALEYVLTSLDDNNIKPKKTKEV